jgi:hypothetical protein
MSHISTQIRLNFDVRLLQIPMQMLQSLVLALFKAKVAFGKLTSIWILLVEVGGCDNENFCNSSMYNHRDVMRLQAGCQSAVCSLTAA